MHYLDTGRARRAAKIAGCSPTRLLKLCERCISIAEDGMPEGFIALVDGVRLNVYRRRKGLPKGKNSARKGSAGAFNALLAAYPDLESKLIECINNGGGEKKPSKAPLVAAVFGVFVRECAKLRGQDEYPNNTESKARRSVERFVKAYKIAHPELAGVWHGEEANKKLTLGNGLHSFKLATVPYSVVGIDAHEIHCIGTVVIDGPGGARAIPIERLWIYACCDEGSRAVLGYSVAISTEVRADDLVAAVKCGTVLWERRAARIGDYVYRSGSGLPYGTIKGLGPCRPSCIKLDNAAAHYSKQVQNGLRRSLGCTLTWGPVGCWWSNAITERLFRTLETHGFQILPSSTGSNTQDVHRGNSAKEATKHGIRFDDLVDLVDVLFAEYNSSKCKALGGISPLEALTGHLDLGDAVIQRPVPPRTALSPPLGVSIERLPVRGNYEEGRRPYVEIDESRYTSPSLAERFDLIGERVVAHVDGSDMREVPLYSEKGASLGTAVPDKLYWRENKHSRWLRKQVNKAVRRGYIDNAASNPIEQFIALSARAAYDGHNPARPKVSKDGTRAAAASHETKKPVSVKAPKKGGTDDTTPVRPIGRIPKHLRNTDWSKY
ncbi:hypothetical protein [Variovorax soli]|nr:hypothetical protein [Variovorax soli]